MNIFDKIKNIFFATNKSKTKIRARFGTFIEILEYKYYQFEITDIFINGNKYYLVWVVNNSNNCDANNCVFYLGKSLNKLNPFTMIIYGSNIVQSFASIAMDKNILISSIGEARNIVEKFKKLLVLT